ncbi:MAG: ribosomal RNA small subunit methyltransferase A [Chloroflexi bacterium]|nr:ribosomal RNA small subunit methyltransferase A [Chloroflexota bacterium]
MAEAGERPLGSGGSLLRETRWLLKRFGLRARKGLAQHFLVDRGVMLRVVEAAELSADDWVVEVGPGLGLMTRELAERAGTVLAVELDEHLAAALAELMRERSNISIINRDILKVDPEQLLGPVKEYKVVANLPYYITAAVLRHFLERERRPRLMVTMVQKEVARNIVAGPGGMSLLSLSVQLYGRPRVVTSVSSRSFYPAPKVDSAIVAIHVHPRPWLSPSQAEAFFRVARAGFSQKRKLVENSLSASLNLPRPQVEAALIQAGIEARRRAQSLSLEEWLRLYPLLS